MTGEKSEGSIEEEGAGVDGVFLEESKIPYLVKKNSSPDPQSKVSVPKLYPCRGSDFLSSRERRHRFWGPPALLRSRYGGSFPWVKWPGLEAGHSPHPPFTADVENECSSTFTAVYTTVFLWVFRLPFFIHFSSPPSSFPCVCTLTVFFRLYY